MTATARCTGCGTELGPQRLACPICGVLVHAQRLGELAAAAQAAEDAGDLGGAMVHWRSVLDLLPPEAGQAVTVAARIDRLGRRLEAGEGRGTPPAAAAGPVPRAPALPGSPGRAGEGAGTGAGHGGRRGGRGFWGGLLVAIGLALWKLKAVLLFVVSKAKFLLLGLSKSGTAFSMLLSLGVYWVAFGWAFALGLVLSIYVHEMGHVWALSRLGIRASWPMFLPGIGAVVRLQQRLASPREDARVGLAGPLWGLGAAVAAWLVHLAGGGAYWAAIARVGAWINLFNLLPVWQLDGGRAFRALARGQRALVTIAFALAWWWVRDGLLALVAVVAAVRTLVGWNGTPAGEAGPAAAGDRRALVELLVLIAALSALVALPVPGLPSR